MSGTPKSLWPGLFRLLLLGAVLCAGISAGLSSAPARGDEIELLNGKVYRGRVKERTGGHVVFQATTGGGTAEMTFPASKIKSIRIGGDGQGTSGMSRGVGDGSSRPASRPAGDHKPTSPAQAPAVRRPRSRPAGRSVAELDALISKAGSTPPDWWDSVALAYPKSLDLAGTNPARGWAPQRNLGAYWYSVINPNPGRWRQGVRLLHHVAELRKADPQRAADAWELLARSYLRLLKDYPRAAFWYRKLIATTRRPRFDWVVSLAECYWRLGSRAMAVGLIDKNRLERYGGTPQLVKLWAEMGEFNKAIAAAEAMAHAGRPDAAYLAAGDVCRRAGKLDAALRYYQKVLALDDARRFARCKEAARSAMEAVKVQQALLRGRLADGSYTGRATGYRGPVQVRVVVRGGRIASVDVVSHREDMPFTSITDVPRSIVARGGFDGVDTVTGATVTAEAIIGAAARAVAKAVK